MTIDASGIRQAEKLIRPHIRRTPVIEVDAADFGLQCARLWLKLELLQHTGSFKPRGAFTNLLMREVPPVGVAAASGGNHGVATAYASQVGYQSPRASSFPPSLRLRKLRAFVVMAPTSSSPATAMPTPWRRANSGSPNPAALPVHAYDQPETLLGQGTVGMEFEEQAPDLDTVLVAVGGGGLIGGIAAWYAGRVKIVGVEPEAAPTLWNALRAGKPVDSEAGGIAADSLAPKRVGELMFPIAHRYVDSVALVSDEAIGESQRILWRSLRIAAEPGGAAAFSALLSKRYVPKPGERVGVLVCGGNTDAVDFDRPR